MTTEDDFQTEIADRFDTTSNAGGVTGGPEAGAYGQLLTVFADWLEDRDDPRAEGYRVLGKLVWTPWITTLMRRQGAETEIYPAYTWWNWARDRGQSDAPPPGRFRFGELPGWWWGRIRAHLFTDSNGVTYRAAKAWTVLRAANDAAARAWARTDPAARSTVLATLQAIDAGEIVPQRL